MGGPLPPMTIRAYRFNQGSFDGPTIGKTHVERLAGDSELSCPLSGSHSVIIQSQFAILRRAIVGLFSRESPTAVARFVVPIWIWEAIQRVLWRRCRTHVTIERFKRVPPLGAHRDTSSAIAMPLPIRTAKATSFSAGPSDKLFAPRHPVCLHPVHILP